MRASCKKSSRETETKEGGVGDVFVSKTTNQITTLFSQHFISIEEELIPLVMESGDARLQQDWNDTALLCHW